MSAYFDELCRAMALIAARPGAVFLGQAVGCAGTAMSTTLRDVPAAQRIEMPVAEDMQLGMCAGIALAGGLPVAIYPRFNFLLLATSQLVLHLDKLPLYSAGGYRPKVIVRTAVATDDPLDPGPQHLGDFTDAYRAMLKTVAVQTLYRAEHVVPEYEKALARDGATLLIEHTALY